MRYLETLNSYKQELDRNLQRQIKLTEQFLESKKEYEERNPDSNSDNTLSNQDIEKLKGEQEKLNNFDVVLAVVGTMKAGKSTTINAIVGREVMPNRSTPMTALPTLIRHQSNPNHTVLRLKVEAVNQFLSEIRAKLPSQDELENNRYYDIKGHDNLLKLAENIRNNQLFKEEYQGNENVIIGLSALNDLVRLSQILGNKIKEFPSFPFEAYRNTQHLPEIYLPFEHFLTQENQSPQTGRLSLLDTPGPNEAGQHRLKEMLNEQLERSSAILLILDYTQLGSEATDEVKRQINQLSNLEADRLFIVVNKFDQKDKNSLDENGVKEVVKGWLKDIKIEEENIFPVSTRDAYLANRMASLLASGKKPSLQEIKTQDCYKWIGDFANLALGNRWNKEWDKKSKEELEEIIIDTRNGSCFPVLMEKVIDSLQKNAPIIAMKSALKNVEEIFERSKRLLKIYEKMMDKTKEELGETQHSLDSLKSRIQELDQLKKRSTDSLKDLNKDTQEKLDKVLDNYLKQELENIKKSLAQNTAEDRIEIEDKYNFTQKFSQMLEERFELIQKKCRKVIEPELDKLQKKTAEINKDICELFKEIKKDLKDIDIEIEWTCPSFENFTIKKLGAPSSFSFEEELVLDNREQDGIWGSIKRGVGSMVKIVYDNDWGYDEVVSDKKTYITAKEIKEQISSSLKDGVNQLQFELKTYFGNYGKQLDQYIEAMKKKNEQLIEDLETAYRIANNDKENKTQIVDQLRSFIRESEDIQSEIKVVRQFISPSQQN